ncbi:family 20 glycosylhydrolase [Cellulomonas xiejunii]|uniref:beta-N-acetylhexosaminidase n=1 Tax=Cellulomonas xiejunii TaxID=2968083 RepID=A0ABY5KTA9_9CELL|nr:family 20 glycosylhydrolase [Cellulomonas xiejunii]MCC2322663.1 beta-N-acetylhexosaminidase [Cellulomonas xiejunii]UUI72701.1 beta-N-acetylhexosaminidase [Cellulomonas xiejunii]
MSGIHGIVPAPLVVQPSTQAPFVITRSTVVVVDADEALLPLAVLTADLLGRVSGRAVEVRRAEPDTAGVVLMRLVDDLPPGTEAYRVVVGTGRVRLEARSTDGLVHAVVTLRQLLRERPDGGIEVAAVRVEDAPRYAWRGLSLDVARHFVSVPDLKVVIGLMAHYKLNVLHLHLTDDQAWRLDMPSRPELVRRASAHSVGGDAGGYYSGADWDEILAFARARAIRVVPEIDVPGHVNAALHAYGELNPDGQPADEYLGIDVGFSRLHDDLPATHAFLADVFGDLAEMTPGRHVHIGGDEVLAMGPDEYARLVRTAAAAVTAHGKRVVAWQEAASVPDLPAGTVVQYWDTRVDAAPLVAAAHAGARVLLSPAPKVYLDMRYEAGVGLGQEWAGTVELRDAYEWAPASLVADLPPEAVVGVEAAVWTETLRTLDDLTTMLLPRLAAVAEVAWSEPARRDFDDFTRRLRHHGRHWDRIGLAWHRTPQGRWDG